MAAFEKGHKKAGGRVKGVPNHVTRDLKQFLREYKSDDELRERWDFFWNHRNPMLRWKVFEIYLHYRFGKPATIVAGAEEAAPIKINVSAIPQFRVPAQK